MKTVYTAESSANFWRYISLRMLTQQKYMCEERRGVTPKYNYYCKDMADLVRYYGKEKEGVS